MKIRASILILVIIFLTSLTGCWDYREYESLAMVTALGFDCNKTGSEITVTLVYLVPGGGSTSQSGGGGSKSSTSSIVVKATGTSIDDSFTQIQQAVGKRLFFGYMQVAVFGNSASKQIVADIIGYFNRSPNIRTSAYIAVTPQSAEEVLSAYNPNVSEPPGNNIHELIDQSISTGNAFPVSIQDFEEDMAISGVEAVAPRIIAVTSPSSSGASSGSSSGASSGSSSGTSSGASFEENKSNAMQLSEQKTGYFVIDGMAVFEGEKLAGWLDCSEAVGLGLIRGKNLDNYEIAKTSAEAKTNNTLVFRITKSKSKIKIKLENDKPAVYISVYVEADLRKFSKNVKADFFKPGVIDMLNKKLEANVKNELADSIKKGQKKLKADAFAIGFNFYRQFPALWHRKYEKTWSNIFPTLQINISVTAKVIDTGTNIEKFAFN